MYGLEVMQLADLKSGTLYPLLARLEDAGLVRSDWEVEDSPQLGRPRRRYYELTGEGELAASEVRRTLRNLTGQRLRPVRGT
jgi:DNA-binding PadR family transcriptional regulator